MCNFVSGYELRGHEVRAGAEVACWGGASVTYFNCFSKQATGFLTAALCILRGRLVYVSRNSTACGMDPFFYERRRDSFLVGMACIFANTYTDEVPGPVVIYFD